MGGVGHCHGDFHLVHLPVKTFKFISGMGWLRFVGSLKVSVSFAKEPLKRDYILQKRPNI